MTSIDTYNSKLENMRHRINQIDSLFPAPDDHTLYLYGFIPGGLKCHKCQSVHLEMQPGNRTAICLVCRKVSHLTAGTFLHGIRRPADWVRGIWLLEDGVAFSANMFSQLTGMAVASVSAMLTKLLTVIAEKMIDCKPESSRVFLEVLNKRTLHTPALKHPMSEQDIFDELENESKADSLDLYLERVLAEVYQGIDTDVQASKTTTVDATAWSNEKMIFKLLSSEPRSYDSIVCAAELTVGASGLTVGELAMALLNLELAGLIQTLPGQMYSQKRITWAAKSEDDGSKKKALKPFFDFIYSTFHGISRKYLQLYQAAFWCYVNRTRWSVGSLFAACLQSRRLTYNDRLAYVSPPVVSCFIKKEKT